MKKILLLISVVMLTSALHAQQERKLIRQGNGSYKDQKYTEAEESYRKALEIKPQSVEANYNIGNTLYKQKKYLDAAAKYSSVLNNVTDKKEQANIYYNMGNSYLMVNKLDESIKAYKQALKLNPEDKETKFNLAYAQRMLLQQQQQQQNKQNDKNNKNDKKQDQNKNDQNKNDQNKNDQNKNDQNKDKQDDKQQQNQKQDQQKNISQEDANRILEAMQNEEKDLQKKLKMEKVQKERGKTLKNW